MSDKKIWGYDYDTGEASYYDCDGRLLATFENLESSTAFSINDVIRNAELAAVRRFAANLNNSARQWIATQKPR